MRKREQLSEEERTGEWEEYRCGRKRIQLSEEERTGE